MKKKKKFQGHIYTDAFCYLLGWRIPQEYHFTRSPCSKWKKIRFYIDSTSFTRLVLHVFKYSEVKFLMSAVLQSWYWRRIIACLFFISSSFVLFYMETFSSEHIRLCVHYRLWDFWSVTKIKQDSLEMLQSKWSNKAFTSVTFYSLLQIFSWCNLARTPLKSVELCQFMLLRISPSKCYSVLWIFLITFSNSAYLI